MFYAIFGQFSSLDRQTDGLRLCQSPFSLDKYKNTELRASCVSIHHTIYNLSPTPQFISLFVTTKPSKYSSRFEAISEVPQPAE